MKIAFLVTEFPAISEPFILRQITGLLERGHRVDIFACGRSDDPLTHRDVETYSLPQRTFYLPPWRPSSCGIMRLISRIGLLVGNFHRHPSAVLRSLNVAKFGKGAALLHVFREIVPFLGKGPYDIVHCQFGPNGMWGALLREVGLFNGKLITTFHGYDVSLYPKQWGSHAYRQLFSTGDLFLCVSEHMRDQLLQLGCDERKIVVHKCGIDVKRFRSSAKEGHNTGRVIILTVARLIEKKGVPDGIRAVAKVLQRYPNVEYRIVGDGMLRNKLMGQIEELKVGGSVRLLGWKSQEEIVDLLKQADILLAPSITGNDGDEEGIPTTIMEAFALGIPVVSTQHSGIPELVQDGQSGFLVPERDADALAQKLECLIKEPEKRHAMGRNGRTFVEQHHDIDQLNDQLVKIYQQLLNNAPLHPRGPLIASAELT